jgi:hypothetical protein
MSNKRKRRPSRPAPSGGALATKTKTPAAPPARPSGGVLGFLAPQTGEVRWPVVVRSIGRGAVTVGSSPLLLAAGFGSTLVLWLGFVALGLEGPGRVLVNILALPPISTYSDAASGVSIFGLGPGGLLAATLFVLIRAVVIAVFVGLTVQVLEEEGTAGDGFRRGLRAIPVVLAVNLICLSVMIIGNVALPYLGPGLGFLGWFLTLVGSMFLLVFGPIAAVREGGPALLEIRRGARAALMPGNRHLLMCLLYIFLTLLILVALAPGGGLLGVNPSVGLWVFALVCTFVHLTFLAAFAYRWMAVEDEVPDEPVKLRRR